MAALQETHFRDSDQWNRITGYTWHTHNVNEQNRRGGAAILIANSVPHSRVTLNTPLNCVAVKLKIGHTQVCAISLYISPTAPHPTDRELDDLVNQIQAPLLLMGDVNAHHPAWGSNRSSERGDIIESFIHRQNLTILNTGAPTRLNLRGEDTAIDLTCCTNTIHHLFEWEVDSDPGPSDHYRIKISLSSGSIRHVKTFTPGWCLKRADWKKFEELVDLALGNTQNPDISVVLGAISSAAQSSVPKSKNPRKKASAPWWTPACNEAKILREKALKRLKRHICEANRVIYKNAKAHCKEVFETERKKQWEAFASKFNRFTPLTEIWQLMRTFNLKRKPPGSFPSLNVNGQEITDPKTVMNTFAQHYSSVSSNDSYPAVLRTELQELESNCNFDSDNSEIYNKPFTMYELTRAISACGNTSVGPDGIHYEFFRHLSKNALTALLAAINDLFAKHNFPATWQESIIIPIPKANKDKKLPQSYRPISLTSCASKITERMINTRLKHHLESNYLLDKHQCGFRAGKSTSDNLVRLVTDIRTGFYMKKKTLAVFLDIKAAFDRVQKPALTHKLHQAGLRGHLAHFLTNFLNNRTFRVRCGTSLSDTTHQDQGLPQGSVLSPTLFLIMINDMFKSLPQKTRHHVKYSLFADDVAIWATHLDSCIAERHIQDTLDHIASWCKTWGFTLSTEKSVAVGFHRTLQYQFNYRLTIDGEAIKEAKDFKFLGVTLDKSLTFNKHITELKSKCAKRTNLLRSLAGTTWGGDRKTILQLYQAIIRPIIEYCSLVYHGSLTTTQNETIEIIQNKCIRAATGALRDTNCTALLADANMPTCRERREHQLCKYFIQIQSAEHHPVQECFKPVRTAHRKTRQRHPPLFDQVREIQTKLELKLPEIAPRPKTKPFWLKQPPQVEFLFKEKKADTLPIDMQSMFQEYKSQNQNKSFIYTDGSKQEHKVGFGVGFGVATAHMDYGKRLPDNLSIFTAEATALLAAVKICVIQKRNNVVICSDSKSVLQALKNVYNPTHHIIAQIQEEIPEDQNISFLWIPGHASIPGNEKADELAKLALENPEQSKVKLPVDDCKALLQHHIKQKRQKTWDQLGGELQMHDIKPQLGPWASSRQNSRHKEVMLTRLRTGRTCLNAHWVDNEQCPFCNSTTEPTVEHILLECSLLETHRQHIKLYCRQENIALDLPNLLGDTRPQLLGLLFRFLKDTKLVDEI